jgi:hypothetical protein
MVCFQETALKKECSHLLGRIGTDLLHASNDTIATLTASELIEVNQDHGLNGAVQGVLLGQQPPPDNDEDDPDDADDDVPLRRGGGDPEGAPAAVSVEKACSDLSAVQWEWSAAGGEKGAAEATAVVEGSGPVRIQHKSSGLLLTVPHCDRASWPKPGRGPELVLAPPDASSCGGKNQLFTLQSNGTILSAVDGACLNVVGNGGGFNSAVQTFAFCNAQHSFSRDVWVLDQESSTIKNPSFGCLSNASVHVSPSPSPTPGHHTGGGGTMDIWAKHMSDGSVAVALINLHDTNTSDLAFNFSAVGLSGSVHVNVRDGWAKKDVGRFHGGYVAKGVLPHGSAFLRLTSAK